MKWFFQTHDGYQDIDQSTASESFSGGSIRDLATAVVREGIQNALDARDRVGEGLPVVVRMTLGRCPSPANAHNKKWFGDLFPHLQIPDVGAPNAPRIGEQNEYLLFEDFNTKGLVGNYLAPYKPGEENNFVNFMYHDGITGKTEKKLGSRGVGKIVFTMASRIRSTFAYTIRADDDTRRPLLIGKNLLRFRELGGKLYAARAYFLEAWPDSRARMPVHDSSAIAEFVGSFPITRDCEPGLSLVIPFLDPAISRESLRYAIVKEYHYAILRGELVIELNDHGQVETFAADRLPRIGEIKVDAEVALARWAVAQRSITHETTCPAANTVQKLEDALIDDPTKAAIAAALNRNQRFAVRIPMYIHPKMTEPIRTFFDVFGERAEKHSTKPAFVRELLPVTDVRDAKPVLKIRALVVIPPGPLADYLRSAEGANHTDWSPRTDRFQERYKGRLGEIRFVATAVNRLIELVYGNLNEPVGGIATRYFSSAILGEQTASRGKARSSRGPDAESPPINLMPKPTPPYRIQQTPDGFTITHSPTTDAEGRVVPERLRVRVAYDVANGSPWTRYEEADFDFRSPRGDVRISAVLAEITCSSNGNRFSIENIEPGFEVTARGFDPNRDLIVDVTITKSTELSLLASEDDR